MQASYSQKGWLDKFTIRKTFETKTLDDDKAAVLSFTSPKTKSNSYLVNAGLGYNFVGNTYEKLNVSAFFVYNINTQTDKKQQNYKLGSTMQNRFKVAPFTYIFGTHSLQYVRDYVDTNHSVLLITYWNVWNKSGLKIGSYGGVATSRFFYYIQPQIGLEYQNLIDAKEKKISAKGYDFRGFESIGASFMLRKDDTLKIGSKYAKLKFLELTFSYNYRESISRNINGNEKSSYLFKAGLNWYITKDISLGASYNKGENPVDGTAKQEYWQLAFQVKLNK